MKQVVLNGPGDIVFQDVPVPVPARDEVLIRNLYCGICGTDVHHYTGNFALFGNRALYLGHEVSGTVEAVGEGVAGIGVGDYVVIDPVFPCGYCGACRAGRGNHCANMRTLGKVGPAGFSDFSLAPRANVYVFDPDRLHPEVAVLAEPLACVLHGLERLAPVPVCRALVIGCGPIGLLFLQALRLHGVTQINAADIRRDRLQIAGQLGADQTALVEPDAQQDALLPELRHSFDYVIDCTGNSKVAERSLSLLDDGGKLLIFGVCPEDDVIRISPYELYRRDLQVVGAFSLNETMDSAVKTLQTGKIVTEPLIDSIRPRDDLIPTIHWLEKGNGEGRVVLAIQDSDG